MARNSKIPLATLLLLMTIHGPYSYAGSVVVENNVHSSADSGGNSVSPGGSVTNGTASASASVQTNVNGKNVESVSVKASSSSGETRIEKKISTSTDGGVRISTNVKAEARASSSETNGAAAASDKKETLRESVWGLVGTAGTNAPSAVTRSASSERRRIIFPTNAWARARVKSVLNFLKHALGIF